MKFDINELVERFGCGFLFANKHGYIFYCCDSDKNYYRITHEDFYEGDETDDWVEFVKTNDFITTFHFIDKDGNKTEEPVYYE